MGLAKPSAIRERTLALKLDEDCAAPLAAAETDLGEQARADLSPDAETSRETLLSVRTADSDNATELQPAQPAEVAAAIPAAFRPRFGYPPHASTVTAQNGR